MRLVHDAAALASTLERLIRTSDAVSVAVAWASSHTPAFKQLVKAAPRLKRVVIGTHFYQTDPAVLAAFVGSNPVRFILQPAGVFHPKIYLFQKRATWTLMVGSANFTSGALTVNSEAMLELTDADPSADEVKVECENLIETYWKRAKSVTDAEVQRYQALRRIHQPRIERLAGTYGNPRVRKPPIESDVMSMDWPEYLDRVRQDKVHGTAQRLRLLSQIREAFVRYSSFSAMPTEIRRAVAGLSNSAIPNSGWFGSMGGAGQFQRVVNGNSSHLSDALALIPMDGPVDRAQYDHFIARYTDAFNEGRHGLGTATRLLAMKRPDLFVCVDSKNKSELCAELGLVQRGLDYSRYWDDVVERIRDAPWWRSQRPRDKEATEVWDARAAFLDAIFFSP